jgi:NTE family protein
LIQELMRRSGGSQGPFQGLFNDKPIRRFVSRCAPLPGIAANLASGRLDTVALTASSYDTGKSVSFFQARSDRHEWSLDHGVGVATTLTLDHVMASGAIPLLFPPVRSGSGLYGDGNVRQQFPLSPLIRLGAERILVIDPGPAHQSVETRGTATGSLAETLGMILDSMVVDRIETDVARLREINALLAAGCGPGWTPRRRPIDCLLIRPTRSLGSVAVGLGPPRCRTLRLLARAAGGWDERVAGLFSYLWVDRRFTDCLFDLGYQDARERHQEIEAFLASPARPEAPSTPRMAG